jgi:hypothetical protein
MPVQEPIERCVACRESKARDAVVWDCLPVPCFGDAGKSSVKVAVIGLNPALDEFREKEGRWKLPSQRLSMVGDFQRSARGEMSENDVAECERKRASYFTDSGRRWHGYFEGIEELLGRINWRWSFAAGTAVHVDLVACATRDRWGKTAGDVKDGLLENCRPHFLKTLSILPANTVLLLNGRAVCDRVALLGEQCSFACGPELIAIEGRLTGRRGTLQIDGRRLPFFGWDTFLRDIPRLQRLDVVFWIRQCLARGND